MKIPKNIPTTPGVYLFIKDDKPIYIGKARNLASRLSSYAAITLSPKTSFMVKEAQKLKFIKTGSEFEALILEAKLVRKHMPHYNIQLKDDKTPLYIGITKEEFPRVITLRQRELEHFHLKYTFGPYLDGRATRSVLRLIRKAVPYSHHKPTKGACIYHQIGLCNPCPSVIIKTQNPEIKNQLIKKYQSNIKRVRKILSGEIQTVQKELIKSMAKHAKNQNFEEAAVVKKQISALEFITNPPYLSPDLENPNLASDIYTEESQGLYNLISPYINLNSAPMRIECFDIAHLAGSNPTASMVTFTNGLPDKSYYRHFRVSMKDKNNDADSMASVLNRRLKHLEDWGAPDLIILDGGKPQLSITIQTIGDQFPVIALAKKFETIVVKTEDGFKELIPNGPTLNLLRRIRDEAHRFARRYHHKLIQKDLLKPIKTN